MGFDGQTEAVGAEGVLALQVGADSVDVGLTGSTTGSEPFTDAVRDGL